MLNTGLNNLFIIHMRTAVSAGTRLNNLFIIHMRTAVSAGTFLCALGVYGVLI